MGGNVWHTLWRAVAVAAVLLRGCAGTSYVVIPEGRCNDRSVYENSALGTLIGQVTAEELPCDGGDASTPSLSIEPPVPSEVMLDSEGRLLVVGSLDYEMRNLYEISVRATVSSGATTVCDMRIYVLDVNEPPVAVDASGSIGEDADLQAVVEGVDLTAMVSDQDAGENARITPTIVSGNDGGVFEVGFGDSVLQLASPLDFEVRPTYALIVRFTDNGFPPLSAAVTVTITVRDVNEPPTAEDLVAYVVEGAPASEIVGTVTASDPDAGDALTFSVYTRDDYAQGSQQVTAFSVSSSTGTIFVEASELIDYEVKSQYVLTVRVTDTGELTSIAAATIHVEDVNEAPNPDCGGQTFQIDEGSSTFEVGTLSADDPEDDDLTFSLISGDNDFRIETSGNSGTLFARHPFDFEEASAYQVRVNVSDPGSLSTECETVNVVVNDVNEAPVAAPGIHERSVSENATQQHRIGHSLAALFTDPDADDPPRSFVVLDESSLPFGIDVSGTLYVASAGKPGVELDFESASSYDIQVSASDKGGLIAVLDVRVTIEDADEAPILELGRGVVPEDAKAGDAVDIVIRATDPECSSAADDGASGSASNGVADCDGLVVEIVTDEEESAFQLDISEGETRLVVAEDGVLNYEARRQETVRLRAVDAAGHAVFGDAVVDILDVNDAPVCTGASAVILENAPVGTELATISAEDEDPADLHFVTQLTGSGSEKFSVARVGSSSRWVVFLAAPVDFETSSLHILHANVTDSSTPQLHCTAMISITIADVAEAPRFVAGLDLDASRSVVEGSVGGRKVAAPLIRVEDDDAVDLGRLEAVVSVVRGGVDGGVGVPLLGPDGASPVLELRKAESGDGYELYVVDEAVLDFEATSSLNVTLAVNDVGGITTVASVIVEVIDVNESPVVTVPTTVSVSEHAPSGTITGEFQVEDKDAPRQALSAHLEGDDAALFALNVSTLNTDGVVQIVTAPGAVFNYEAATSHDITMFVSDDGVPSEQAVTPVSVQVVDANDAPVFRDQHTADGFEVEVRERGDDAATEVFTIEVSDDDVFQTLETSVVGCFQCPGDDAAVPVPSEARCAATVSVGAATGSGTVRSFAVLADTTLLDYESYPVVCTTVQVTDDGSGTPEPPRSSATAVIIRVTDDPDVPVVTSASTPAAAGFATWGGEVLEIQGTQLEGRFESEPLPLALEGVNNAGRTLSSAACTVVVPNESMRCEVPPGTGGGYRWRVRVGGQWSQLSTDVLSYAPPSLTSVSVDGVGDTRGGELVTIVGFNFGGHDADNTLRVTYGVFDGVSPDHVADDCWRSIPHTQITCRTVAGVGRRLRWRVEVNGQANAQPVTAYTGPTVHTVSHNGDQLARVGGVRLVVLGDYFGTDSAAAALGVSVEYGTLLPGATAPTQPMYTANDCRVVVNHTTIECVTAPASAGTPAQYTLAFRAIVAGMSSAWRPTTYAYQADGAATPPSLFLVDSPAWFSQGTEFTVTVGCETAAVEGCSVDYAVVSVPPDRRGCFEDTDFAALRQQASAWAQVPDDGTVHVTATINGRVRIAFVATSDGFEDDLRVEWNVDNQPPSAPSLLSRPDQLTTDAPALFEASAFDESSEIKHYLFWFDCEPAESCPHGSDVDDPTVFNTTSLLTTTFGVGEHRATVVAVDEAGNTSPPTTFEWSRETAFNAFAVEFLEAPPRRLGWSTASFVVRAVSADEVLRNVTFTATLGGEQADIACENVEQCAWSIPRLPPGEYSLTVEASAGHTTAVPATAFFEVVVCDHTTFGVIDPVDGEIVCEACPRGAACAGNVTIATIGVEPGYWISAESVAAGRIDRFYPCRTPEACRGTVAAATGTNGSTSASAIRAAMGDDALCAVGYRGPVCAVCAAGFQVQAGLCQPCPETSAESWALFFSLSVMLALLAGALFKLRRRLPTPQMKLLLSFGQMLAAALYSYSIPWPPLVAGVLSTAQVFMLQLVEVTSVSCTGSEPAAFYTGFTVVLLLVGGISAALLVAHCLVRRRARDADKARAAQLHELSDTLLRRALQLCLLAHAPVSLSLVKALDCIDIDDSSLLEADMRVSCDSSEWAMNAVVAVAGLCIITFGVPVYVGVTLWRVRHRLAEPGVMEHMGWAYEGPGTHAYAWELFDVLRKWTLSSFVLIFNPLRSTAVEMALSVCIISLAVLTSYRPFSNRGDRTSADYVVAMAQFATLVLVYYAALLFKLDGIAATGGVDALDAPDRSMLIALVLAAVGGTSVASVALIARRVARELKNGRRRKHFAHDVATASSAAHAQVNPLAKRHAGGRTPVSDAAATDQTFAQLNPMRDPQLP